MKELKILGTGCAKCVKLYEQTETAAKSLGMDYTLVKETDLARIMSYGVMSTPALVVDGEVKSVGRIPSVEEIKTLIG